MRLVGEKKLFGDGGLYAYFALHFLLLFFLFQLFFLLFELLGPLGSFKLCYASFSVLTFLQLFSEIISGFELVVNIRHLCVQIVIIHLIQRLELSARDAI